jgi:hypothetical protein
MKRALKMIAEMVRKIIGPVWIEESAVAPWWMGMAYIDWRRRSYVMYAVPLHHAVSLVWRLNQAWCSYRGRKSWIEDEIEKAIEEERKRTAAEKTKLNQVLCGDRIIFAAIIMKHGGSLRLFRRDIITVPPDCVIEKEENPFGVTYRIKGTEI